MTRQNLGGLTWKDRLVTIMPIVLVFTILSVFLKCSDNNDYYHEQLAEDEYKGVITKKYLDAKRRNSPVIVLLKNDHQSMTIEPALWFDLWDISAEGDSIIKNKGIRYLIVKRMEFKDSVMLTFRKNGPGCSLKKRFDF